MTDAPAPGAPTRRVVHIEDNAAIAQLVRRLLARRPHIELVGAVDGASGLELARAGGTPPALVLVDMNLPDMGGEQVVAALAGDPRTAAVPVVVVSGDDDPQQRARTIDAGAVDYVVKPFDLGQFLAVVDRWAPAP